MLNCEPPCLPDERLRLALNAVAETFDPVEDMLRVRFPANATYHTTLSGGFVHPTYRSLVYALALLDGQTETERVRAERILERLAGLQDCNPESPTYGIWSWFLEEPLEKMAPPDWNFADFCGGQILEVLLEHRARLRPELATRLEQSVLHAARSIERRNVGPDYTNIAIMGSFVTIAAGSLLGLPDLEQYGLLRFRRFYDYTCHQQAFTEYNSPNYTFIALNELSRIRRYVQDKGTREMASELYRMGWIEVASHFHPPTRQWAGPHSRAYSTFLAPDLQGFLQRATGVAFPGPFEAPELYENRLVHDCPGDLKPRFQALDRVHTIRQTFSPVGPVIGTTYFDKAFTLGTVNRGDLWNQRRALLAYWGTETEPRYLHLRFLHDEYDFSAAHFFSSQSGGDVLAGIAFAHDQGDTHLCLDMIKKGTIRAGDMRVRFEFGNVALPRQVLDDLGRVVLDLEGMHFRIDVPFGSWDGEKPAWETGGKAGCSWIDLVLYHGEPRDFHLPSLSSAAIVFALGAADGLLPEMPKVNLKVGEKELTATWKGHQLALSVVSCELAELLSRCHAELLPSPVSVT